MGQTQLALLALVVATMFALTEFRSLHGVQAAMIRNELSLAATGVAVDVLEEIGSMAFDENTFDQGKVTSPLGLTDLLAFGPGFDQPSNDVDDWHNTSIVRNRLVGSDTLRFAVNTVVRYADESDPTKPVASPSTRTRFKITTVRVHSMLLASPDTVVLSRTYACGARCSW
jgi:hypothetical protein